MSPDDKPTFYLYGIGYRPNILTLGTLVYNNYAVPDARFVTFPKLSDEEMADEKIISDTPVSGTFVNTSNRKYGFGLEAVNLAKARLGLARSKKRVVTATSGRRVTLNHPDTFFRDRVLEDDSIRKALGIWLSTAKSSYVRKRITLQKPRVYCLTGFYEFTDAVAKTEDGRSFNMTAGVSDTVMAAATTVPVGVTIGPFADRGTMAANIEVKGPAIWAARFHRLDVAFLKKATKGDKTLDPTTTIELYPDATSAKHGLRASLRGEEETEVTEPIAWPEDAKKDGLKLSAADAATVAISEAEELSEDDEDNIEDRHKYWQTFAEAEIRVKQDVEREEREAAKKAREPKAGQPGGSGTLASDGDVSK